MTNHFVIDKTITKKTITTNIINIPNAPMLPKWRQSYCNAPLRWTSPIYPKSINILLHPKPSAPDIMETLRNKQQILKKTIC